MTRSMRYALTLISLLQLAAAAGLVLHIPLVTRLWPLPYTTTMSFTFLASIAFAAVASTMWCVARGETAAVAGVALDYLAIFIPTSILMFRLSRGVNGALLRFGASCVVFVVLGLVLLVVALRAPVRDARPVPRPVRLSFAVFVVALVVAGGRMVLGDTHVLPWQVSTTATVIYGWMFLGAAAYFAYGLLRPGWFNAGGQLAGFLAYDVVLIVPFVRRLPAVAPGLRGNLVVYLIVIAYSALLAIYYLFVHPSTRLARRPAAAPT